MSLINNILNYLADKQWTNYGISTEVTSYSSSSNKFTVPGDGIVKMVRRGTSTNKITIYLDGNGGQFELGAGAAGQYIIPIPVFKGMKFYVSTTGSNVSAYYVPYI